MLLLPSYSFLKEDWALNILLKFIDICIVFQAKFLICFNLILLVEGRHFLFDFAFEAGLAEDVSFWERLSVAL